MSAWGVCGIVAFTFGLAEGNFWLIVIGVFVALADRDHHRP